MFGICDVSFPDSCLKVNRAIKETLSEPSVLAQIGLISDTHFQERLFALPEQLARVWGPLDLILHAGDVGDLSVLDQLGQIAPVAAVHGNDEPAAAVRDLPEQQLLMRGGVRLLLWHSHYPDPVVERANRQGNWGPTAVLILNVQIDETGGAAEPSTLETGEQSRPVGWGELQIAGSG